MKEWLQILAPYVVAAVGGILMWFKVDQVHLSINSRFDQWIEATKVASFAEGVKHEQDRIKATEK